MLLDDLSTGVHKYGQVFSAPAGRLRATSGLKPRQHELQPMRGVERLQNTSLHL
jgi:hypothetical protein